MLTSDIHVILWSNDDKLTIIGDAKSGFAPYNTKPNIITIILYI